MTRSIILADIAGASEMLLKASAALNCATDPLDVEEQLRIAATHLENARRACLEMAHRNVSRETNSEPDAQCTNCDRMYYSGDGHPDRPICRICR